MRVAMLGPLRLVAEDGSTIDLGGPRLRMLLARLALDPGKVVSAEVLIDGLWGETPPADATNALQSLVSRLRRGLRLENGTVLESHPAGYRLAIARDDVDVYQFERLASRGHDELKAGQPGVAAATLRAALDLWRGPPMADVADAPFAGTATTRLAELHAAAVEDRVEADLELGRHQENLAELRTMVAEQPLRERRAALLIKALYLCGRQADALAAFETTRRTLADELGVEPGVELRRLHLAVLRGEVAPADEATRSTRLPARLTSFVGRQQELREVVDRLTHTRLVSLVGPGGAGKTRLSTEIAATLTGSGVTAWFVELAGVGESSDVAAAVLGAVGLREIRMLERPPQPAEPVDRLVEALAGQHCLIVLDNCEHVITAAATLADTLLAHCPALRILATSREPLAITGEAVFPLGPLAPPEAVRLFVDRAVSAHPGFVLDERNTPAVDEICQRLDGLPLALELAAARLRSMTVGQIAERLDDRFRLLTAGNRTSLPRHRTLRSVVEWSWDLLEKPELTLARRLSVFVAGATVESAVAVCADDELPVEDVVYVLASLVEKSLAQVVTDGAGQPRYRMLETVRAYAAERLTEAGEDTGVHAAFDRYFLELTESADLHGHDQVSWLARLAADQDNVMTAIRHAADVGDADTAVRLAMATGWFWALSGRQRDSVALVARVADVPGPAPRHARAALRLFAALGSGGLPDRKVILETRVELAGSDAMTHYPMLAMIEPLMAVYTGDLPAAEEILRRALNHPDPWGRAAAKLGKAFLSENEGRAAEAELAANEALADFRVIGDRWGQAMALCQISERHTLRGDHVAAIAAYEESIRLVLELGALDDLPELRSRLAAQRARAGDLDTAEQELRAGLALVKERKSVESEALLLCSLASVHCRRGDFVTARELVDRASELLVDVVQTEGHYNAFYQLTRAAVEIADGHLDLARVALIFGLDAMTELRDLPVLATMAERAALLVLREGDPLTGARLIGIGTALRGTPDLGSPELTELIAELTAALGDEAYSAAYAAGAGLAVDDGLDELAAVLDSTKDGGPPPKRWRATPPVSSSPSLRGE
jgi:predicted ATPase/DNA-binding SARP family transcriptional activator